MTRPRFHDGFRLVATPSAVSCSRLFVAYTLDKWGASFVINDAVQVVDKLVTNAVNATGTMDERPRWTALAASTTSSCGCSAWKRVSVSRSGTVRLIRRFCTTRQARR